MSTLEFLPAALAGLGVGLSLIVAIGAQNAFVLRQGLRGQHVAAVVAICAVSDLLLIVAGVAGTGAVLAAAPGLLDVVRVGGAAFLLSYAFLAARRATRPQSLAAADDATAGRLAPVVGAALALTWLNPHVYLDTVVLLGSTAQAYGDGRQWAFAAGAGVGSVCWFILLGYGARRLRPAFQRPGAWRLLDAGIAIVMTVIALSLLLPLL